MKLAFSSQNKFYDRKESCQTKYYRIRSKLTVFKKFLTFSFNICVSRFAIAPMQYSFFTYLPITRVEFSEKILQFMIFCNLL